MAENPQTWFEKSCEYAIPNDNSIVYGDLFLLKDDAPKEARESYVRYVDLLKKVYISTCFLKISDKEIIGIQDNLSPKGYEQAKLTMHLIKNGLLKPRIFKLRLLNN